MAEEQERVKSSLQTRLHDAVKQCQIRFGGKHELATSAESCIACLCSAWEAVLHHGLRRPQKSNLPSSLKQVSEMTGLSRLLNDDADETSIWPFIALHLPPDERQRFLRLSAISTDTGRGRAWLRSALNEHSLERQLQILLADSVQLRNFYRPGAFLLDEERNALLPSLAAGVNSIVFALDINLASLNSPLKTGYTVPSSASSTPNANVISGNRFFAQLTGSVNGSFDSVDDDAIVAIEVAPPLQKAPPRRRTAAQRPRPMAGQTVGAAPDTVSVRSDELVTSSSALSVPNAHKRTNSDQMIGWRTPMLGNGERPSSRSTSLTSDSIEEAEEAGQSWTDEPQRIPVLEGSTGSPVLEDSNRQPAVFDEGPGSRSDGDGGVGSPPLVTSSLSVPEMRKAMLAVIDNKDAVERENRELMAMLDEYKTKLASAEDALRELESRAKAKEERDQAVIDDLRRENVIVKKQFREYVRSVKMISPQSDKDHSEEDEEEKMASIAGVREEHAAFQTNNPREKLAQLAQMQGELLELNERLQRTVKEKDNVIQRLRNELTHLRGPLPDENVMPSGVGRSQQTGRWNPFNQPLVHLWIPIALLQRRNGVSHHVYQVYIRIGDSEEWNVYRRYADFRRTHATLRKTFSAIDRLEFPPKAIKNMREKVVEERRVKLQSYMRRVINHIIERNPEQNITKSFLFQYLPILDDSN